MAAKALSLGSFGPPTLRAGTGSRRGFHHFHGGSVKPCCSAGCASATDGARQATRKKMRLNIDFLSTERLATMRSCRTYKAHLHVLPRDHASPWASGPQEACGS